MCHANYDVVEALLKAGADPDFCVTEFDKKGKAKGQSFAEDAVRDSC